MIHCSSGGCISTGTKSFHEKYANVILQEANAAVTYCLIYRVIACTEKEVRATLMNRPFIEVNGRQSSSGLSKLLTFCKTECFFPRNISKRGIWL